MNCIKMRFLMVFCACFAFALNAGAAPTVRVLGKTTPSVPTKQNMKPLTTDGNAATARAASGQARVMTTNRLKTQTPTTARISTISIPKIVDVTDKPQINPGNPPTVPTDVTNIVEILNNYYTKQQIDEIINNNYEQSDIDVVGQYGVTVDQDGNTYTVHLTGIDGSEDPSDIYVYQNGQFRKYEFNIGGTPNDFSGNVNVCNDWESEAPCNDKVDVNITPTNNSNNG